MSPATQDEPQPSDPETPRRASPVKHANATTPANRRASAQAGATPKSAPAAAGQNSAQKKKTEPSLLGDFFLGRPSPARVQAQREAMKQRRKSMAADTANVREELRQEMRAAAVRRVQQPGGVSDRVKAWQKANAAAMKQQGGGVPHAEDVASEPTEVAVHIATESVTEEDRVRIKMRQKPKKRKPNVITVENKENHDDGDGEETERETPSGSRPPQVIKLAPKKRIVSDDNWMKRRKGKSPPRNVSPKPTAQPTPMPIPRDFLQRTAQNPTVQSKIKDWADRVDIPEPKPSRVKKYRDSRSGATVTVEEDAPSVVASDPEFMSSRRPLSQDSSRAKPTRPRKPKADTNEGIRVAPVRKKEPPDDGIRVRPIDTKLPDDGIRVQPVDLPSPDDVIEVTEEPETEIETPTKKKASRRRPKRASRSPSPVVQTVEPAESETTHQIPLRDASDAESEVTPTVAGSKSLADIPFGYSAFSELDLPMGADARNSAKRPKAQRNQSFKAVPKVLKKVVTGAKDIIQEMAEPPKPIVANKPQSIESWLNDTVDPFVESANKTSATEEPSLRETARAAPVNSREPTPETQKKPPSRSPSENRVKGNARSPAPKKSSSPENTESQQEESDATPKKAKSPATPSTGLKRRRATRATASPAKSSGRKPFREILKEAFRGESGGHKLPPTVYPSCEADDDKESIYDEDEWESTDERRPYPDDHKGPDASELSSAYYSSTYDSTLSSDLSSQELPRRRPPTKGFHELSTIVSEESGSTIGSETLSDVSQTTITQTTAFTRSTELSRKKSQKPGLKRRLTKHSDFVSVLSLPDTGQLVPPSRSKSIKSSRSLHRKPSRADKGKVDELLDEFADDEHFYGRELKAVVDGVIPVLLRDVMDGESRDAKEDAVAKSVVNMGMALEKLRDVHRRVPVGDIGALLLWLEDVSPIYDNYLDVWRLGFQGLIINLAPRHGRFDDDDSLLNAMPLNEDGDIVGENGERVDVAYLLKRPLIRVKWMVKFLKAATAVTETHEAERLLPVFAALQEKARRRHREETARMMDEDANNTDTTRCRDLRNLLPLGGILMNKTRQVAALDVFSLDLDHSTGQRLGCQVEMIFRDDPAVPADKGDILIREIGNESQSWLLFPPVPRQNISARPGDGDDSLIAMIRGLHNGNEWFELLKLSTNNEEQIEYWLRILGSHPTPPATRKRPSSAVLEASSPQPGVTDVPVGERRRSMSVSGSSDSERSRTPTQYGARQYDGASSPAFPIETSRDAANEGQRRPSWEMPSVDSHKTAKPAPNTTPYRDDGAPPPPIHRTLGQQNNGLLAPPVDNGRQARLKRRMSSPLKHEYHPSDISSDSSSSMSDDDDDDDSGSSQTSSDDLDEDEVPDTFPGYSLKDREMAPVESVVSENSITPSHSASQVAANRRSSGSPEHPVHRFVASVSYWSNRKGIWRDINNGQEAAIEVHPGCMEVHLLTSIGNDGGSVVPLVALVLTPVVMIRRSTALDLEVRSPASPEARLKIEASMFRFRAPTQTEAKDLYEAVHISRLNNARYIQLSEEARFRSFGQMQGGAPGEGSGDGDSSSRRRSWFGRKNSYRASTRAPSVSQGSISTSISAGSFLRRLMGGGTGGGNNASYNIDESTLDKPRPQHHHHHRPSTAGRDGSGGSSSSGSGSGSGSGATTPPRSASVSLSGSGHGSQAHSRWSYGLAKPFSPDQPLEIRCHLNVQNNRWLDKGDCVLHVSRPPPGVRQELPLYHGLEKRVIVTHATKKNGDRPLILLDAVLGSKCFSLLGTKGVMCSVWENLRDEEGNVGVAPRNGAIAGRVIKWCFQCKSVQQAEWIMKLLTSEVPGLLMA